MSSIPRFDPSRHHRRSIRLRGYDYTTPGYYFVTLCTNGRQPWFGEIAGEVMTLNADGRIAREDWLAIPNHYRHVGVHTFTIMPDHVHGIIELTRRPVPGKETHIIGRDSSGPAKGSLGAIIGSYRAGVVRRMNVSRDTPIHDPWQRGYHDIIIRDARSLQHMREYIERHPHMVDA